MATSTGVTEVDSGPGGLISRLAETDNRQQSVTETVQVRVPTAREQDVLQVPADARVYELTHAARQCDQTFRPGQACSSAPWRR